MMPDPLHPAIVHFPIVLAVLSPVIAGALVWAIRSGRVPLRAWIGMLVLQAALVGSGWLAAETGEREEERSIHGEYSVHLRMRLGPHGLLSVS